MGRIKSTLIKKTAKKLLKEKPELFGKLFNDNKKILGNLMPSKWIRNRIAGQIARTRTKEKPILPS